MSVRLPVVVIVGRPNVGKSTLFNRIVGRRVAVVEDTPGITRDRLYAEATWNGKRFQLVDTGGILFGDDDPLVEQIKVQAEVALAEADFILFLVDCVDGLTPGDHDLADRLRSNKRPLIVLANKADNQNRKANAGEFYTLGIGDVMAISGLNGNGVADALDEIVADLPENQEDERPDEIRLAIVGRPNVGKSSLLNAFTGETRVIVSNIPGTTRDAIDTEIQYRGDTFRLIDTAGLRRRGKIQGTVEYYMAHRATQAVERCNCALVVVDGVDGLTDGDKRTCKLAHDEGKGLVIAVNKWDQKEPPDGRPRQASDAKREFLKTFRNETPEVSYAPVCFTSAIESAGLEPVLEQVKLAVESWNFRIGTGQLNRLIQDAVFDRPYQSKGRSLRIYYATQVSSRPPTFVLFCNDAEIMHFSYKRYLENQIRKQFPLPGTPIRVIPRTRTSKEQD